MSKITLDNFSDNLKEYLRTLGITEQQVIEIINANLPQDLVDRVEDIELQLSNNADVNELRNDLNDIKNSITSLSNSINNMQNKMIDVMIYLNMSSGSEVDNIGYWYDDLSTGANITFIEGLILDTDRNRIFGAPGNVIFKELDVPFTSDQVKITVDFDNNFIESVSEFNVNVGATQISIDNFVYKVE